MEYRPLLSLLYCFYDCLELARFPGNSKAHTVMVIIRTYIVHLLEEGLPVWNNHAASAIAHEDARRADLLSYCNGGGNSV
jgi:hypothetical protein